MRIKELFENQSTWQTVSFDNLPDEVQSDICQNLAERHPFFIQNNLDAEYAKANLSNLVHPPQVLLGKIPVASLMPSMSRQNSTAAVDRYIKMLGNRSFEFDPVLIARGQFYDGGHRVEAYFKAGRRLIPVVECGNIVLASDETWERWTDGDKDASFPLIQ